MRCGGQPTIDWPSNSMLPCFGRSSPEIVRSVVDLAGPIAADERHHFALLDAQRNPVQRLDRAVADGQVFDGKK